MKQGHPVKFFRASSFPSQSFPYLGWWIFAILSRAISSTTFSHWFHPDEWCQTFEPANLIAHGFGYHSQEIGLHLRNLTWPVLLAGVLQITHFLAPASIDFRIFTINFFSGSLDLLILWGWQQLINHDPITAQVPTRVKHWGFILLLLPWFALYESISPRGEHLSEIALWVALGCMANGFWLLAGTASVAIFAFRYPSGLFSAGIFLALLVHSIQTQKYQQILRFLGGALLGGVLFGLADWTIYGRPWESFWMYLQYNIFTGSSSQVFGRQGLSAYAELFAWDWATYKLFIPVGILLLGSSVFGLWNGIKRIQPWAFCIVIYLLGHCLVPHKEGRFMIPVEILLRWSSFCGLILLFQKDWISPALKTVVKYSLILAVGVNGLLFIHTLRADLWKELGTYREIGHHLKTHPQTCAILTMREITSILMPFENSSKFPNPSIGSYQTNVESMTYMNSKKIGIHWIENPPQCNSKSVILFHAHKAESGWSKEGCTLLSSSILNILPQSAWADAIQGNKVSGAWYECTPEIVNHFKDQRTTHFFSHTFGHFSSLPKLGITAKELEDLGIQTSPPPKDLSIPTLANPNP